MGCGTAGLSSFVAAHPFSIKYIQCCSWALWNVLYAVIMGCKEDWKMERVSPTNDLALRKVFASAENKDILQGLIADFYGIEAENLVIEHPYSISDYKEVLDGREVYRLREVIRDISASFSIADFVAECQVRSTSFFDERAIFYPLDRFCKNYNKAGAMLFDSQGKPFRYSSLRPVYALNILGYTHFPKNGGVDDSDALRIFEIYDISEPPRRADAAGGFSRSEKF